MRSWDSVVWRDFCLSCCESHYDVFVDVARQINPQHSAALPSEMLLFCSVAHELGANWIIESGRKHGYSTELICSFPPGFSRVVSVDRTPIEHDDTRLSMAYKNLSMKQGDGGEYAEKHCDTRCSVFFDGPKGDVALDWASKILPKCRSVAIHDLCRKSPCRPRAERMGAFFSDDREFLEKFGEIDKPHLEFRGYSSHGSLLGEANVIGVIRGQEGRNG